MNDRWQEMISENLASSSIPGFKKQELSFGAVSAGQLPTTTNGQPSDPTNFSLSQATAATNFSQGAFKYTGGATDVALEGPGFFEVQLPNGNKAYTRDGEFHINGVGQIVTKEGFLVMTSSGPVQIDRQNPAEVSISSTGEISQGVASYGSLRVIDFKNPQALTPITSGYFVSNDPKTLGAEGAGNGFRQGYLETSNTSPVHEMVNLIGSMRSFEANQKVIQLQDDRMGKAIQTLGKVS